MSIEDSLLDVEDIDTETEIEDPELVDFDPLNVNEE